MRTVRGEKVHDRVIQPALVLKACCCLPDPFRGIGAWRKTMEPQKPGCGPEVVKSP